MLVLLLGLLASLVALWLWTRSSDRRAELAPVEAGRGSSIEPGSGVPVDLPRPDDARRADLGAGTVAGSPPSAILSPQGTGSIRGRLVVDPGVPFPESWAVVVTPSRRALGVPTSEVRRVQVDDPTGGFAVEDLPLGGYEVRIEAPGMNSRPSVALLTPVSAHPYLVVTVSPTGFIDGFVLGGNSLPAEGLLVTLEGRKSKERVETRTRGDGMYRFEAVADGEYLLYVGPPEDPLVTPRELSFESPSMRFPTIELPRTVEILIHTRDNFRSRLAGVTVSGFGPPGGRFEVVSDSEGEARAESLPPGRYRLTARSDDGRRARITIQVEDAPDQEFYLFLH